MPKLLIRDMEEEYVYEIFDDEVSIGRGAANAVQVGDSHASKHHAVLRRIRSHWKLIDLESSNGTKVNGQFRNQHWLSDGDSVSIGSSVLEYDSDGAPQGPPEVAAARAAAPKAVAAKPVGVKPKPAGVKPAVPVSAVPAAVEAPAVTEEPQVSPVAPASPTRARGGAPARRARTRDRYEPEYDEDGARVRREPAKNNSMWIGVGLGVGAIVFTWLIFTIFDNSMSHNREVLYKGRLMADRGDHKAAIAHAERYGRPGDLDYDKLQTGMQAWKLRVEAAEQLRRNNDAQEYWNRQIYRKSYSERRNKDGSIGNKTQPVDALGDDEIVPRIRQFLFENWDTQIVRTFLGSEHSVFPYYRDLLRQYADESYTAGKAWGEIQDDVLKFTTRRDWGRAVMRMKRHGQVGRLTMLPEAWKKLQAMVDNEVASVESRASSELVEELERVKQLVNDNERDTATQQVRILVDRFNGIPRLSQQIRDLREELQLKQ